MRASTRPRVMELFLVYGNSFDRISLLVQFMNKCQPAPCKLKRTTDRSCYVSLCTYRGYVAMAVAVAVRLLAVLNSVLR